MEKKNLKYLGWKIKLLDIRIRRLIQHYDTNKDKINCISYIKEIL